MAQVIIIRGPAASGKTTIAKLLAGKIGAKIIHLDSIMRKNRLDLIENGRIPPGNFLKGNRISAEIAGTAPKKKTVIIDGCFYYMGQITDIGRRLKARPVVFTLSSSLEECIARDSRRNNRLGPEAVRAVYNLVSRVRYGTYVSTRNRSSRAVLNEILKHLHPFNN